MLTWNPSDILAITEDEANLDPLEAAGYKARLLPPPDGVPAHREGRALYHRGQW
jgi:hypothetical protein